MTRRTLITSAGIVCSLLVLQCAFWSIQQHRWYALRDEQWAEINKLREFPPSGWSDRNWQTNVSTAHNVWGNTLYLPDSATEEQMRNLLSRLRETVVDADSKNSLARLRAVYDVLLEHEPNSDFIMRYRDSEWLDPARSDDNSDLL